MKFRAAVVETFGEGPFIREFETSPLKNGEVLVKMEYAGVCGSDLHIFSGNDPRIKLPMIPGHEGVGFVAETGGTAWDVDGEILKPGDRVVWDRGIVCKRCYYCVVEKKPYLCPNRQVYGITFNINDSPFPNGCYSEYVKLSALVNKIKLGASPSAEVAVAVTCSGATSYHAVEDAGLEGGETVVVQGPGPLGIFTSVFCREKGVSNIIMTGSSKSSERMELAKDFGVSHVIYRDKMSMEQQKELVMDVSKGKGAAVVFEMAGTSGAVDSGQYFAGSGGSYVIAGVAVPVGKTGIEIYENLVRKNVSFKGIWVSDTSHLYKALAVAERSDYPFAAMINRKFNIEQSRSAIESVEDRKIIKSVIKL